MFYVVFCILLQIIYMQVVVYQSTRLGKGLLIFCYDLLVINMWLQLGGFSTHS